jgi:hypothetical protein
MLIISVDPGKSGGIAWQTSACTDCRRGAGAAKFPETEADTAALFRSLMEQDADWFCYLERVGATPQMGVTSAFTFGKSYGLIRGLLIGLGIPFEEVSPMKWQAEFGLRQGKKLASGDTEKHNAIKAKAQQLFPWLKITHATGAALLLCEYGVRQQRGLSKSA